MTTGLFVDPFDAYQRQLPRPRTTGEYLAAAAEIDPNPIVDVTESEARELQQRADDITGERFGFEVGARRYVA